MGFNEFKNAHYYFLRLDLLPPPPPVLKINPKENSNPEKSTFADL